MQPTLPHIDETELPTDCHDLPDGWQVTKLGRLVKMLSGGTPSKSNPAYWNGDIPWLSAKDLKSFRLSSAQDMVTDLAVTNGTRLVPANRLLILVRGMTLLKDVPVGLTTRPVTFNQDLKALEVRNGTDAAYLAYWLVAHKEYLMDLVDRAGHGTGRLPTERLIEVKVCLPSLSEQVRIVEIMDGADATVRAAESLIEAKTRYKRALAEQLLTGKRRFPVFEGQTWQEIEIGDLFTEVERPVVWDDEEFYNLVSIRRRSEGLFFRGATQGKTIKTKTLKTTCTDDFLISRMQVVHGAWGRIGEEFDGFHVSDSYITLVPKPHAEIDVRFFDFLSQTPYLYRLARISSYGVHIEKMTFNLDLFLRTRVRIPPTVAEQRCIAEVLGLVDEEIALLRRELEALKQQKQGLMQKLLTGKVRVKEFAT